MSKLVVAEKPSVAQSLARVIGATKRQDGYLEGNGYLVSWCVGHLVELSAPERYDERFAKWRLEDLPILPEPFWTVQITAGGITATSSRFQKKDEAESLAALCREEGEAMIRTVETKEKLEKPPLLYDLTSLQRDANRILGFTAQQTLDYTQSLYEKKLVTYPRTDSRYLTDDMREMLPALIASVADKFGYTGEALRTDPVRPNAVFDSSKVSDHHAIIPTARQDTVKSSSKPTAKN